MRICVMDLELNKPSRKIIQIGAVCLDVKTGKTCARDFNVFINPHEPIDPYIVELCGITDKIIKDEGKDLYLGLTEMWAWMKASGCSRNVGAWGNDWSQVLRESRDNMGIVFEWPKVLDIKEMATVLRCAFPNNKAKGGLLNTMNLFGLTFNGRQHNALDDAKNTGKLLYKFKEITEKYNAMNKLLKETV